MRALRHVDSLQSVVAVDARDWSRSVYCERCRHRCGRSMWAGCDWLLLPLPLLLLFFLH
jgi:hypothetical protein